MDGCHHIVDMTGTPNWRLLDDAANTLLGPGTRESGVGNETRGDRVDRDTFQWLRNAGVVYRPLQETTPTIDLALAWLAGNASPVLPNFLQAAREATKECNRAIMDARSPGRHIELNLETGML